MEARSPTTFWAQIQYRLCNGNVAEEATWQTWAVRQGICFAYGPGFPCALAFFHLLRPPQVCWCAGAAWARACVVCACVTMHDQLKCEGLPIFATIYLVRHQVQCELQLHASRLCVEACAPMHNETTKILLNCCKSKIVKT